MGRAIADYTSQLSESHPYPLSQISLPDGYGLWITGQRCPGMEGFLRVGCRYRFVTILIEEILAVLNQLSFCDRIRHGWRFCARSRTLMCGELAPTFSRLCRTSATQGVHDILYMQMF